MRSPSTSFRLLLCLTLASGLSACGSGPSAADDVTPAPTATGRPAVTAVSGVPTVPGYPVGRFPPVPLLTVPDVTVLTESQQAVSDELAARLGAVPGLQVTAARCDPAGLVVNSAGTIVLSGDGAGVVSGPDGTVVQDGAGAGVSTSDGVTVVNDGDGSGTWTDGRTSIVVGGDGSGSYSGPTGTVTLSGDGAGTATDATATLTNNGDGSGTWTDGTRTSTNDGDGSGLWTDGTLTITNDGSGHAQVGALQVDAAPLPPLGPAGRFPDVAALAPVGNVCGTLVRLPGDVLFDFDDDAVRADAAPVLQVVADALTAATQQVRVEGHTDGFGSDDYNQDLSQRRSTSVVSWLTVHGVSAPPLAEGFGETRPIAPETVDGHDDPAGRQLNRRVEFVIPGP